MGDDGELIYLV